MTGEWEIYIHDRGGKKAKTSEVVKDFDATIGAVKAFKQTDSGDLLRVHVPAKATDKERKELIGNGATLPNAVFRRPRERISTFRLSAAFASLKGLALWVKPAVPANSAYRRNVRPYRTVKKERRRLPTSGESVANALDRWDEEGGAAATLWPLPYETGDLLEVERRVLKCLGADPGARGRRST